MEAAAEVTREKQTFQMEWRQCPGCPQEFKVLTTSKQVYHSTACGQENGYQASEPVKKKAPWESLKLDQAKHGEGVKRQPPSMPMFPVRPLAPLKLDPIQIETVNSRDEAVTASPIFEAPALPEVLPPALPPQLPPIFTVPAAPPETGPAYKPHVKIEPGMPDNAPIEEKWQFYVQQGQAMVSKMAKDRLNLATLAISACQIEHGGGSHWSGHEGVYTLKRFAEEVGISYKTLANWVRVKRNVYDKLLSIGHPIDVLKDWTAMNRVAERCDIDNTPEQVLKKFGKWDKKGPFNPERYFLQGLRRMRSLNYYLNQHDPAKDTFNSEDLKELKSLCQSISKWVNK